MPVSVVEEKIRRLPEIYLSLVNSYVDSLLAKAQTINSLKGSLSQNASPKMIEFEKEAWIKSVMEKHTDA